VECSHCVERVGFEFVSFLAIRFSSGCTWLLCDFFCIELWE